VSALGFTTQTNGGAGWTVPAGSPGSLSIAMPGALTMTAGASNACQGATFTVHLKVVSVAGVDGTSYPNAVLGNAALVNYWPLGESTIVSDTFGGTAGALISSRSGETGATWTQFGTSQTNAVLTDANRVRRSGTGLSLYSASGTPASADYAVGADIHVKSNLAQDAVSVLGRVGPTSENFYMARWTAGAWEMHKFVNGTATLLQRVTQTLTVGQTYRLKLKMVGTSLSMWANGAQVGTTVTDGSHTAAGKAGVRLGIPNASPAPTNTTGLHMDNFFVAPLADDAEGTNDGNYWNAPTLGVTGALSGGTAAEFDGVNDYVSVARQIQDDFSIEFWFKSTQGLGTDAQWWGNAGLVDASVGGAANDFGTSLRSDGRVVAGIGTPDVSLVSTNGGYNDGGWHHVVFTRARATGALRLYVDGAPAGTATANTLSLTSPTTVNFGRIAGGSNSYAGALDEVAFYGIALSPATVSDHYARR
jgi:hypothetical protein